MQRLLLFLDEVIDVMGDLEGIRGFREGCRFLSEV
jgi:hypothetical protein